MTRPYPIAVVRASVPGSAHARSGVCEDANRACRVWPHTVVLGAADGVGSAPLAAIGARTALDAAVEALGAAVAASRPASIDTWRACLRGALGAGHAALGAAARGRGRPAQDLATTVLLAVLGPSGAAAAQVGNGAVVADLGGRLASLTVSPSAGRYANLTWSLTDPDYQAHAQVVVRPEPVAGLALVTDGLEDLCLVRKPRVREAPHPGFFRPLFAYARTGDSPARNLALAEFLNSEPVRRRSDDDRTLVVAAVRDLDEWAAEYLLAVPDAEVRR